MSERMKEEWCAPEESWSETGKKKQVKKRERDSGKQKVRGKEEGKECDWFWRRYNLPGGCYIVKIMTVISLSPYCIFLSGCHWIQKFLRIPKLNV